MRATVTPAASVNRSSIASVARAVILLRRTCLPFAGGGVHSLGPRRARGAPFVRPPQGDRDNGVNQ